MYWIFLALQLLRIPKLETKELLHNTDYLKLQLLGLTESDYKDG